MALAFLCCSWGVSRASSCIWEGWGIGLWVCAGWRDFLGFVLLHLLMPTSMLCLIQQQPEVFIFLLKRGEVKSAGQSPLPMRVSLKHRDSSQCRSSGYVHTCERKPPSDMQINILLSFPETSVLWTKSPSTGRSLLKASSWTLAVGFSSASFLRVNYSLIMSSNKITSFGSNNDYWLQEGGHSHKELSEAPKHFRTNVAEVEESWKTRLKRDLGTCKTLFLQICNFCLLHVHLQGPLNLYGP